MPPNRAPHRGSTGGSDSSTTSRRSARAIPHAGPRLGMLAPREAATFEMLPVKIGHKWRSSDRCASSLLSGSREEPAIVGFPTAPTGRIHHSCIHSRTTPSLA